MIVNIRSRVNIDPVPAWRSLTEWFTPWQKIVVLTSGGVDSSLLLAAACVVAPHRTTAVTADSPSLARAELKKVEEFVASFGVPHVHLPTDEGDNPLYQRNSGDRCYYCKTSLYSAVGAYLKNVGEGAEQVVVVDGTNQDDLQDHRPSLPASREHGIRQPYLELRFGKELIRYLAKEQGLPMWNKPAMACLASRIQESVVVTPEKISMVERAEEVIKAIGVSTLRVRYHESGEAPFLRKIARIEVSQEDIAFFAGHAELKAMNSALKEIGFDHVTLDLEGYSRGGRPS